MIDRGHDLPITKQAEVLRISRGSIYYLPRPVPEADLAIMRRLDRLHLEFPFAGSRMLRGLLVAEGCEIGRRHVKTLMRRMGIEALYRRPRTTKPEPGHKNLPVSAARLGDHATESGVGDGHHLHPDGARLRLSGRGTRLVQPQGAVLAAVDHHPGARRAIPELDGCNSLKRGIPRRLSETLGTAADAQREYAQKAHILRRLAGPSNGRPRSVSGQPVARG